MEVNVEYVAEEKNAERYQSRGRSIRVCIKYVCVYYVTHGYLKKRIMKRNTTDLFACKCWIDYRILEKYYSVVIPLHVTGIVSVHNTMIVEHILIVPPDKHYRYLVNAG